MDKLIELLLYFVAVIQTGDAFNSHLYELPGELWEHLVALGEWVKQLVGWAG